MIDHLRKKSRKKSNQGPTVRDGGGGMEWGVGHLCFSQTWENNRGRSKQTHAGGKLLDIEDKHVESRPERVRNLMAFVT